MKSTVKYICALLCVAMLLCAFAGCGEKAPQNTTTQNGTNATDKADANDTEKGNGVTTAYAEQAYGFQTEMPKAGDEIAIMHTSMGDVYIRLFPEAAPKAVENFTTHAKNGYYNGLTFHRVMKDFMIQGGDPDGDGTGGKSIWGKAFEDEFDQKLLNLRGALAMANSGENSNGSQFFINQAGPTGDTAAELKAAVQASNQQVKEQVPDVYEQYVNYYGASFTDMYPTEKDFLNANLVPAAELVPDEVWELYAKNGGNIHLDGALRYSGGHTVFGHVVKGMDVVDAIAAVKTDDNDKPTTAVTITSIEITTWKE